ncbi:MAG: hypothetical protein IPF79_04750 [Ignavibacteria bacterium]|nr:hypothetical protein [Ignavibacteria bacterium]
MNTANTKWSIETANKRVLFSLSTVRDHTMDSDYDALRYLVRMAVIGEKASAYINRRAEAKALRKEATEMAQDDLQSTYEAFNKEMNECLRYMNEDATMREGYTGRSAMQIARDLEPFLEEDGRPPWSERAAERWKEYQDVSYKVGAALRELIYAVTGRKGGGRHR